jgi:hypothetical protein
MRQEAEDFGTANWPDLFNMLDMYFRDHRQGGVRRNYLPKLFGKSELVPNWGYEGPSRGEERAKLDRFLPPITHSREAFSYFPNSFSTHSGE